MKNIFEVDSNEIKRILSLHEESTKNQYLNVISETLTKNSVKLNSQYVLINQNKPDGNHNISALAGVSFYESNIPETISTLLVNLGNGDGEVNYNCITGKFKVKGKPDLYNNEVLETKVLKPFCDKLRQQSPAKTTTDNTLKKTLTNTNTNARKQVYAQKTANITKEIQTSLGSTTPTGQITDTDLDQLISQLNK